MQTNSNSGTLNSNRQKKQKYDNCKLSTLKCGSLNVCGIRRKLLYPEFCNLIQEYDLFCVTETKVDSSDIIGLHGYKFFSQCRKQRIIQKSGGIGVFVKESISPYIGVIESDSDYILWLKLSKSFLQTDEDFIFGVVYIPPTNSRFNNSDVLDLFEVEITSMCISYRNVGWLVGYFGFNGPLRQYFSLYRAAI